MKFLINDSPLGGREGKYVQLTRIRERLIKETLLNVAIEVEENGKQEGILVKGAGGISTGDSGGNNEA